MNFFRIKICGITSIEDAVDAADSGADAIGLNFYHKSPRSVEVELATLIVSELGKSISTVGVFVDHPVSQINEIADRTRLDFVQLHGDQTVNDWQQIERHAFPAIRLPGSDGVDEQIIDSWRGLLQPWIEAGCDRILVDSFSESAFGGTGERLDWELIGKLEVATPLILAGGLNAENVAVAIGAASPACVDVASGVESSPGVKDLEQVRQFVEQSRAAFRILGNE